MYDNLSYTNSDELVKQMSEECDTCILSFSTGKDSIASYVQLRKYFKRIIPYYYYVVPHLSFVDRSIKYYEGIFGCHIYQFPNASVIRMLNSLLFQPPERVTKIEESELPYSSEYTKQTTSNRIRKMLGLPDSVYTAIGVRSADSPMRYTAIKKYGAVNHVKKTFYPVYDWKK